VLVRDGSAEQIAEVDEYPVTADQVVGVEVQHDRGRVGFLHVVKPHLADSQFDGHTAASEVIGESVEGVLHGL
jgi:hypothetical protein